jgi:UPF0755 protein
MPENPAPEEQPPVRRRRRWPRRVLLLALLVLATAAAAGVWLQREVRRPGPHDEDRIVLIEKGSGVATIAGELAAAGTIREPWLFRSWVRLTGQERGLHAGEYRIPAGASLAAQARMLATGLGQVEHQLTVPEGLTSQEIVVLLRDEPLLTGEIAQVPPEGSLLPETYNFLRGESRAEKLARMRAAMQATLDELWPERAANLPFDTREDALVLASIVEKETGVPEERRHVAGVFVNRLRQGMALQSDPTVIYAITHGSGALGRRLLRKDLQIDSPYNTYRHPGLPPGPIANPGRAAIAAVLDPLATKDLYFVADGTGGHVFAETLAEHNRNVARWRKIRDGGTD